MRFIKKYLIKLWNILVGTKTKKIDAVALLLTVRSPKGGDISLLEGYHAMCIVLLRYARMKKRLLQHGCSSRTLPNATFV